jgi:ABC-type multidrug transport system fused ATPase/permease subunit
MIALSLSESQDFKKWRRRLWLLACLSLLVPTSAASTEDQIISQQQQRQDSQRDLSSSSDSRDDHDDYWRRAADYDDYVRGTGDDDFYRYIEDPIPPALLPLTPRTIAGFMFASIGVVLGSSGGIGGGGIVVPIYIIVNGLSPRMAIPLGSVTVLGASLAGLLVNLRERHPLADRPIIDWDLILVMEPLVLVGAVVGSMLHRVVSEKILVVLLVLLLSVVAHNTLAKAKRMHEAENRYIEHLKAARWDYLSRVASFKSIDWTATAIPPGDESPSKTAHYLPSALRTMSLDTPRSLGNATEIDEKIMAHEKQRILIINPDFITLRSDLMQQEKVTPRNKIILMLAKFAVLIFLNIMLGGGAFRSPWGIQCGSVSFWVVHIIMIVFLFSSAWAAQVRESDYFINLSNICSISVLSNYYTHFF